MRQRHFSRFLPLACAGLLATLLACSSSSGSSGSAGASALVKVSAEPAGTSCPSGGTKVEGGVDANRNGILDPAEVSASGTSYVCNGTATGQSSLVHTQAEPAGPNCPLGGTKIEAGLDANGDGTLQAGEVDPAATSYVCALGPGGTISPSTGLHVTVKPGGVSTSPGDPITVRFTLKDDRGFPLDLAGRYSQNTAIQPRFAIGYYTRDAVTGIVSPLIVYTRIASAVAPGGEPTSYQPLGGAPGHGSLVENGVGAGDYTYTFPTSSTPGGPRAVSYDPARLGETHVVWIQASRQTDLVFPLDAGTFSAANQATWFIPAGPGTPLARELVSQDRCDACHARFKAETAASAALHGGGGVDAGSCNVCHNPARTSTPLADSSSFIHRIHAGQSVATANLYHGIAPAYPQDLRRCDACHAGAAQGDQALTHPSALACQGCHDYVSFTGAAPAACGIAGNLARDAGGKPLPCNHVAGPQPDGSCASCHGPAASFATARYHQPVIPPDPNNLWLVPVGGDPEANASYVAAAGPVPAGAAVITYDVKSVEAVVDATITPNKRPQLTFKLKRDGADVVFQSYAPGAVPPVTELMPDFVGSPSVHFAFAVPQDGTQAPADFNASVTGYLRRIWDGSATGAGAGTLTGPDASGYYTLRLTGVQIPFTATMLTGGLGYGSSLASAPPLVQTNLPAYPWVPNLPADGKAQGGLSVPPPNVWKVATGFTGRRAIVDADRCRACHGALGVAPTFHAGQRNDGPSCAFCHDPNHTRSGWPGGATYFIHALHAARKRSVPYTWQAAAAGPGYDEVAFPGTLNGCTTCHLPGTFDFSSAASQAVVASLSLTTVATGIYSTDPLANSTFFTVAPYVVADNVTDYGRGFSYDARINSTAAAAATTLVLSPITGACVGCHDATIAIDHMTASGGQFYAARGAVLAQGASREQCLLCHGPGQTAAIGAVHQR